MGKTRYKVGQVVTWRHRGYHMYGVVVWSQGLSKRTAYVIYPTDPFGAPECKQKHKTKHKWSYQLEQVTNTEGNPRLAPRTVAAYNRGEI